MEAFGGGGRYSSYSFLTSALYGGEWSASRPGRALLPGKGPPVPIWQETGWAPEPVWTQGLEEKILCPSRGSNTCLPDRSQTLYCLNYRGSFEVGTNFFLNFGFKGFVMFFLFLSPCDLWLSHICWRKQRTRIFPFSAFCYVQCLSTEH
jgi:hypothetical protein